MLMHSSLPWTAGFIGRYVGPDLGSNYLKIKIMSKQ